MSEVGSFLPVEKSKIVRKDPRMMIVYGLPKVGKTTILSHLPNSLILDLEGGSEYIEALSMEIIGLNAPKKETKEDREKRHKDKLYYLTEVGREVIKKGKPYDFVIVDTATRLEELVMPLAVKKYCSSPMGKGYDGNDVRELPRGSGYYFLREAFKEVINSLKKLSNNLILVGHLKDSFITKQGKEVQAKDLDLTGKIKFTTCADADAIGYLYRGSNSELMLNFKSSEELTCGSRCPHLKGQNIKIADYDKEKNELTEINWGLIYPDQLNK